MSAIEDPNSNRSEVLASKRGAIASRACNSFKGRRPRGFALLIAVLLLPTGCGAPLDEDWADEEEEATQGELEQALGAPTLTCPSSLRVVGRGLNVALRGSRRASVTYDEISCRGSGLAFMPSRPLSFHMTNLQRHEGYRVHPGAPHTVDIFGRRPSLYTCPRLDGFTSVAAGQGGWVGAPVQLHARVTRYRNNELRCDYEVHPEDVVVTRPNNAASRGGVLAVRNPTSRFGPTGGQFYTRAAMNNLEIEQACGKLGSAACQRGAGFARGSGAALLGHAQACTGKIQDCINP